MEIDPFGFAYNKASYLHHTGKLLSKATDYIPSVFKPWESRSLQEYVNDVSEYGREFIINQAIENVIGSEITIPLMVTEAVTGYNPIQDYNTSILFLPDMNDTFGMVRSSGISQGYYDRMSGVSKGITDKENETKEDTKEEEYDDTPQPIYSSEDHFATS